MTVKGSEEGCTESASEVRARIVRLFSEADELLVAGHVTQALPKYNQIVREGRLRDEDAILRLVDDAVRQRKKCQYRLLSGTAGPGSARSG